MGAAALALLMTAGACGDSGPADPSPSESVSTAAAAEEEAIAVVKAYWDERMRVESSGDYESADFSEVLHPDLIEKQRARYDEYVSYGHLRVGTPELRDHEAIVDGDTALVTMCVNEGPWTVEANVADIQQPGDEFYAVAYSLEQVDGTLLMTNEGENAPADVTC